jgi:hypothetical protein
MKNFASWCPTLALALLLGAPVAGEPSGAPAAPVGDLAVPGGVRGLLRAADLPSTADPATALLSVVRVSYGPGAQPPERLWRYLDVLSRTQAAADALPRHEAALPVTGAPSALLQAWAGACGLAITGGTVKEADGPGEADRRRMLDLAGVSVGEWARRLNAGDTVNVEIPSETVPLPLSPEAWAGLLSRHASPAPLLRQILGDRRAAFLYYGLMALDDETLAYLASHPGVLAAVEDRDAGVFAEWGRSIHIRNGRVQLPGGERAGTLWQAIAGRPADDVEGFIRGLLAKDTGRAAFFYDTVGHLDPARQAFALGDDRSGLALYGAFARSRTVDTTGAWPLVRHPVSPAAVLRQVRVDGKGVMAFPSSRGLWDTAIGGSFQACGHLAADDRPADATWIVDRIDRLPLERHAAWLGALAFAQRVFPRATSADLPAICEAVVSFPQHDALLLSLERIGLDDPRDYAAALRFAARAFSGLDRRVAVTRTAQVQGALALLERAAWTGVLPKARLRAVVMSLVAQGGEAAPARDANAGLVPGTVGRWMASTLLPALCPGPPLTPEGCLIRAASGHGTPPGSAGFVSWEDQRYRVDLGAATATRLEQIRARLQPVRIDDALALLAAAETLGDPRTPPAEVERQVDTLKALAAGMTLDYGDLFGHSTAELWSLHGLNARLAAHPDERMRVDIAAHLTDVADMVLANALVSFAYALGIGDPDDAVLLEGNPAAHHLFDATEGPATEPWHLPQELQRVDRTWQIEGSVLALRTVYAKSWLRRLSLQDPGARVWPDPQDVHDVGETAAAFNPFTLTDDSLGAIVEAIRRGRARASALLTTPNLLWGKAAELGLGEWRCRAALWLGRRDPARAVKQFSRTELLWLGEPTAPEATLDTWGVATRPIDGSLSIRMPRGHTWEDFQGPRGVGLLATQLADVHLRVAEVLADLKLPATLAPDVAAYADWDVMTSAGMAHPDDWFALARAADTLPEDRFLDYVSALTASGPLVPTTDRQ